jgi:predicted kinase/predicted phosphodiesterase
MRTLILTRGCPGSGKSTFIKNNGLEEYTISPDQIRLLYQSPILNELGRMNISMKHESKVWGLLLQLLESRMERGELTVIDATHQGRTTFQPYIKLIEKYRYRAYVLDFADVPLEKVLEQNKMRDEYKFVPEEYIHRAFARYELEKPQGRFILSKPENILNNIETRIVNLNNFKNVYVFGDIHGCIEPLVKFFELNPFSEENSYIFVGDFVDRGINNAEVMQYMISLSKNKNVYCIEGNHEVHLWKWSHDETSKSKEFETNTRPELDNFGLDKSDVREFYRKLGQMSYFTYGGKNYIVTHGGLSTFPKKNLIYIPTEQLIKGVGSHNLDIDEVFTKNVGDTNIYQVHGHRNSKNVPINGYEKSFNLEGKIEFGGHLRILHLYGDNVNFIEIKNDRFKIKETLDADVVNFEGLGLINSLRKSKLVRESQLNDYISSFNFTRDSFFKSKWDELNIKARGLFLNTLNGEIITRSYDKFFNLNEKKETNIDVLPTKINYPLTCWHKYNGYLGLVGYDSVKDEVFISSKSTNSGDFSEMFAKILKEKIPNFTLLKEWVKENNCSLVFEVIEPLFDPHIIEYKEKDIILIDIVKREIEFKLLPYEKVVEFGEVFNIKVKEKVAEFNNWEEFYSFYKEILHQEYKLNGEWVEGFVFEDNSGFMFKYKTHFYNKWKYYRGIKDKVARWKDDNKPFNHGGLKSKEDVDFYKWLKNQDKEWLKDVSIIQVRKKYLG